jgi:transcription-repair coupling factor (superfamily II helicase)
VTGLTVEDFELLVSLGIFNDSLMNSAVYNFKRYEDASLEYTGINKHTKDEDVGLFSTVISTDEYKEMASAQNASMQENPFKKTVIIEEPKTIVKKSYQQAKTSSMKVAERNADNVDKPITKEIDLSKFRVGTIVEHKKYGVGKVTGIKTGKMMVSFDTVVKTFLFPSAFEMGFLAVKEW